MVAQSANEPSPDSVTDQSASVANLTTDQPGVAASAVPNETKPVSVVDQSASVAEVASVPKPDLTLDQPDVIAGTDPKPDHDGAVEVTSEVKSGQSPDQTTSAVVVTHIEAASDMLADQAGGTAASALSDPNSELTPDQLGGVAVAAPSKPKPDLAPRPVRKLKPACLDVSDLDNNGEDCLNLSAGAPRKTIPVLRKNRLENNSEENSTKKLYEGEELDTSQVVMSERAQQETALLGVLPSREFTINECGRIEIDEHAQDGELARRQVFRPGELDLEDLGKCKPGKVKSPKGHRVGNTSSASADSVDDNEEGEEEDYSSSYRDWAEWRQRQVNLHYIIDHLREQALLGHIPTNLQAIISHAGGFVASSNNGLDGFSAPQLPNGSEPPPSPVPKKRRKGQDENSEGTAVADASAVDERYLNACAKVGLQSKQGVLKALRTVEQGSQCLPVELVCRSYLGNRSGQALFLALSAEAEDNDYEVGELRELRNLDLEGQGLGNEAAIALSALLHRCPQLRSVNLARNHISESGAKQLIKEMQAHPSVDSLILDQNPVPSWLRVHLKEVLAGRKDDPWHDTGA